MPEQTSRSRTKKTFLYFLGRWAWVFLVGEATLLLFVPIFFFNRLLHSQVIACAALIAIGTFSALLTRRLMAKYSLFLRILYPALVVIICVLGINWITSGQAGFGFMHDPLYGSPWLGTIPLAMGFTALTLTQLAWRKRRKTKKKKKLSSSRSSPIAQSATPSTEYRTRQQPASPTSRPESIIPAGIQATSSGQAAATISQRRPDTARAQGSRQNLKIAKRKTKNNHLRLVGSEEHRCPYCLEVVHRNDPRGVVICDICHAYHHKDCWDITGRCQVPHQTSGI
jgi:hypothetical protein